MRISYLLFMIYFISINSTDCLKPKKRLLHKYAQKIINYFDLPNIISLESSTYRRNYRRPTPSPDTDDKHIGCDSLDEIKGYFFDVYSSDSDSFNMSSNDLEHLIEYLVTRYPKNEVIQNRTRYNKCHRKKCFQSEDIVKFIKSNYIDYEKFSDICPVLLFNFEIGHCEYDHHQEGLSGTWIWTIGLLLSSVVTIWSWSGAVFLPIIGLKIYKRMLTFMISLAFGCLTSNSILKYIPLADGFEIAYLEETNHSYFFKHLIILGVIFFFFLFERFMKILAIYKTQKLNERNADEPQPSMERQLSESSLRQVNEVLPSTSRRMERQLSESSLRSANGVLPGTSSIGRSKITKKEKRKRFGKKQSIDISEINILGVSNINEVTDKFADRLNAIREENDESIDENNIKTKKPERLCCTSLTEGLSNVKPVGWMAIFGDGLGNFIDGLSIGASINQNLLLGLTTALATWCGNIPQELGDFALLVRAGMSPFQALFYNFCSGNSVYLGCIIGIVFGSNVEAARWIFSISGAATMFLGLAVLLPEMNEEFEDGKEPLNEKLKITFIQVFGILFGYWVMIVLNMYEDDISL